MVVVDSQTPALAVTALSLAPRCSTHIGSNLIRVKLFPEDSSTSVMAFPEVKASQKYKVRAKSADRWSDGSFSYSSVEGVGAWVVDEAPT